MLNNMDLNLWMWIKDAELKEEKKHKQTNIKKNNIKSNDKITKARKKNILEMTVRSEYQLKSHNCYLVHINATSKADNISRRSRFNISQDLKGF